MNYVFFTCAKCSAPMERTMRSRDYWMCRFCEHQMDAWYPDPESQKIEFEGVCRHGVYTVRSDNALDYSRVLVDGPNPRYPSGGVHHFDSPAVKDALRGEKS